LITVDLTIDASVWVAGADTSDAFHQESRTFLAAATLEGLRIIVPVFSIVEVACALARRRRNPAGARRQAQEIILISGVTDVSVDEALVETALRLGTDAFLRGADALYAATAQLTSSTLVSWDQELIQRAGALSPADWLDARA
jgi:predicted nucleic acid-binding protein